MVRTFFVQWDSTNACNLSCSHCYHNDEQNTNLNMSFNDVKNMLNDLAITSKRWNFDPAFHISGGEPLLRKDLFSILDYATKLGITKRILTNGTLIDSVVAKELAKRDIFGLQISIDGDKKTHNRIRGRDWAYDLALKGVENASKEGIIVNISNTLMQSNKHVLEEVIINSYNAGAKKIGFQSLVPHSKTDPEFITAKELYEIYGELNNLSKKYKNKIKIVKSEVLWNSYLPKTKFKEIGEKLDKFCGGCGAGFIGLSVLSDGIVYPCRRLPINIGNISEGIQNIFLNSSVMNDLRDYHSLDECGTCNDVTSCRGCRAIAYAMTGNYMGADPMCFKKYLGGDKNGN